MVATFHYLAANQAERAWGQDASSIFPIARFVAPYGWLGVEVFFMLSGFVICMSGWGKSVAAYVRSRLCRLYPVFWVAVCLSFVAITVTPALDKAVTIPDVLANLTMFPQALGAERVDGVYWTLWVELRFYLLFALVVHAGLTYRRVVLFGALWTLMIPVSASSDSGLLKLVFMPEVASYFLVGIGLYLVHRFGDQPLTWLLVGINAVICLWWVNGRMAAAGLNGQYVDMNYWVCALILVAAMVFLLALARGRFAWMSWRWLTVAGALTYPFYLLHNMVGHSLIHLLYVRLDMSAYAVFPGTIATMLLLAWLVHRFAERPLSDILRRQLSRSDLLEPRH